MTKQDIPAYTANAVQQFDFENMPLTPAQETVALLKQIVVLLTPNAPAPQAQPKTAPVSEAGKVSLVAPVKNTNKGKTHK